MGKFYKEFALKKVLECEGLEFLKNVKVGTEVYLKNDLDNKKFKGLTNQVGITAYSGGYPFSISGDIRSVPS